VAGQSAEGGGGHSLLVVALQPARILAAKSLCVLKTSSECDAALESPKPAE
jgi:hypothetical protein